MKRIAFRTRTFVVALGVTVSGLALAGDKTPPDTDGLPDLIVRQDLLEAQWVVRVERLSPTACSVIEGGVQPGDRALVRFTVGTENIGNADIFVGNPQDHIDAGDG